jgi:hypothetical protein
MGRVGLLCAQNEHYSHLHLAVHAGSRECGGPGYPHSSMTKHRFTWERERDYRRALRRITKSPKSVVIERREFDDYYRVLRVLMSDRLHGFLTAQIALMPEPVRTIAAAKAFRRVVASESELTARFVGCHPECLLLDTLDFGFAGAITVPAVLAIISDDLIACVGDEVPLGRDFIVDRIRIDAELMASRGKE